jgi:hypothetical protein
MPARYPEIIERTAIVISPLDSAVSTAQWIVKLFA